MNKFLQLADNIEADLRELDSDAEELNSKRLANKELARSAINDHHRIQDRIKEGLDRMAEVVQHAAPSNERKFTAAELAAIAAEEAEKKAAAEKKPEAPKLGEGSGVTPEAPFSSGS